MASNVNSATFNAPPADDEAGRSGTCGSTSRGRAQLVARGPEPHAICEEHLQGRFDLEVVDLYQQPQLAEGEQIIAVPTLIRKLPPPCAGSSGISRTPTWCWSGST